MSNCPAWLDWSKVYSAFKFIAVDYDGWPWAFIAEPTADIDSGQWLASNAAQYISVRPFFGFVEVEDWTKMIWERKE